MGKKGNFYVQLIESIFDVLVRRLCKSCNLCADHNYGNYCDNLTWIRKNMKNIQEEAENM